MKMDKIPKIVVVGAGRIGWHLAKRLKGKGLPVAQVVSRTEQHAKELGESIQCKWTDKFEEIQQDADWVLLAVKDDAIIQVAENIAPFASESFVTHTSGGTAGEVLAKYFKRFGVFYPLQSFSMDHMPVWSKIPFCVDASSPTDLMFLKKIAKTIGNLVYQVNDVQRANLHVAAVFANNFSNHCFAIAEMILKEKDLPFDLLHPLMEETLTKALQESPAKMQTGPAIRGDAETLKRHIELLESHPAWMKIYKDLSESIQKTPAD
ncbi:MAG: DUF2520 domain-containing protein [Saprospiraceae bacterium]|nr:DUF2520 domain-containing protein [Saprospiraceae bacterium]